jgi:hypothetical protein
MKSFRLIFLEKPAAAKNSRSIHDAASSVETDKRFTARSGFAAP